MHDTSATSFHVAPETGDEWSGRTWTDRDLGSISEEIDGVASSQLEHFASQLGPEWIAQLIQSGLTSPEPGPSPVRPNSVAPMPLPFVLPAEPLHCFSSVIEPWWHVLKLPEERHAPVAVAPIEDSGAKEARLWFSTKLGGAFQRDTLVGEGTAAGAHLEVMDGWIGLWARRRFASRSVDGPGLIGSFVPVYSHGRALASKASERFEDIVFGCRVPFEFIHSIQFDQWYFADQGGPSLERSTSG